MALIKRFDEQVHAPVDVENVFRIGLIGREIPSYRRRSKMIDLD